jgi:hypothetical protein
MAFVALKPFLKVNIGRQITLVNVEAGLVSCPELWGAMAQDARVQIFRGLGQATLGKRRLGIGSENQDAE